MKESKQNFRHQNVLLIDDMDLDNFINKKLLEINGFSKNIYVNTSALAALEFLKKLVTISGSEAKMYPEVIFIDINMPMMDGFQFIEEFKRLFDAKIFNPKLVLLTSSVFQYDRQRTQEISEDIVFFCLTANHRISLFDERKQLKHLIPGMMYEIHHPHEHKDQWFRYFDTPAQRIFNYDKVINLLFLWCQQLNIQCYFANIFTIDTASIINIVPEKHWLISKNSCLAQSILPVITHNGLFLDDCPDITNEQWAKQEPMVKKYIRPNYQHPNALGHKKISELIIESLINKNENSTR